MDDLNPANALTTLNEVPEELRGHEAMVQVTVEVVKVLGGMIQGWAHSDPPTASEKEMKQKIVSALASALGPVNSYFGESQSQFPRHLFLPACLSSPTSWRFPSR